MKKTVFSSIAVLTMSVLLVGCGGGGGNGFVGGGGGDGGGGGGTPTQSPGGIWGASFASVTAANVVTGFENVGAGNFTVGTAPHTATFTGGVAQTLGNQALYRDGVNSWHVSGSATITLGTPVSTLSFWTRTVPTGGTATIEVKDTAGDVIDTFVPPDMPITEFTVDTAGGLPIGSVDINVTAGEIVIDVVTIGYSGFVETNGAIFCLVAETAEFVCATSDALGNVNATAQGTLQITNSTQVSGSGTLYALPGLTLGNGTTVAALSISAGTVSEGATLSFTVNAAGGTATVAMTPDPAEDYARGSDVMANVAAVYTSFDLFGDNSSFVVSDAGAISGDSDLSCALTGQVLTIDVAFNAYDVALDLAGCTGASAGLNGMYNGLGFTADDAGMDDVFVFAVFDADGTIIGEAKK